VDDLKERTRHFALDVIRVCPKLPHAEDFRVLTRQLLRAATSVGANYRAACRAKSRADFISKVATVEEEADECTYWLDLLLAMPSDGNLKPNRGVQQELLRLRQEANELTAIMVSSRKTARRNK